ncbi:MAG: hypothetical protein ACRD1H_10875, partial [Vicinamibacterales bacterium]
ALAWLQRRAPQTAPWAAPASTAIVALLLLAGVARSLEPAINDGSRDAQRFAETVETLTPPEAVINGWEPEIGFLIDRAIQPPPSGSLDVVVRARWYGGAMPDYSERLQGEYLVVGPFARWVGVYRAAADSADWQRVAIVGPYELYRSVGRGMTASKER